MPVMRNVLGLDLGTHSLKGVEFRQTLRGLEAVQLRSLPRGSAELPLSELVRRFVELHRFSVEHVVAAVPGERLSMRRLSFPFRERRKLTQAVPFAVEEELPFELDDVVVDWEIVGGDRSQADVRAVVAPRGEVSELIALLDQAGCAPRTLEAEGLVLANLAAVFDLPGRRLMLDLGHSKTTCCLLEDGRALASRTVRVGGRHLTEAIAADRGLSFEEAERAKCEEGLFGARLDDLPPQTGKTLERIAIEVVRSLGAWEELLSGGRPEGITLFGGTALLDRIDAFLSERTGIPATRLSLPRPGQDAGLVAGGPPILFAPAIALGLRGTALASTGMNFCRDEFAVRLDVSRALRPFRTSAWLAAAAALLWLVSIGTRTVLDARHASALEEQAVRLYAQAFPGAPAPQDPATAMRQAVQSAHARAEFLGVYRGNLSALDLLSEISGRAPRDLDIALEELSIDRQLVRMRVQARSFEAADRLGAELKKFAPFAGARIGAIDTDKKTGAKRFDVTIGLAPAGETP
jgi:general secretion pathway protein L